MLSTVLHNQPCLVTVYLFKTIRLVIIKMEHNAKITETQTHLASNTLFNHCLYLIALALTLQANHLK